MRRVMSVGSGWGTPRLMLKERSPGKFEMSRETSAVDLTLSNSDRYFRDLRSQIDLNKRESDIKMPPCSW